ncbi:hypothetical protein F4814DRAFT_452317 [Daldinia grandis]|nr:hypothetical protein F4814DRAFT_452317 [Daldinia grandis]
MAETLGVAASGIAVAQIAIQVGGTVVKLKQLWDEVKDVPDDVVDLMDQIDCLDPVLWEVEDSFNQAELPSTLWGDLASKSTTRYCRKALENLTAMVEELSIQISSAKKGRRKITAVKVLLKKDSIRKLERRLENAVRMLTLAQQSYLVALTKVQPDIIVQKFTALTNRRNQYESQETLDHVSETEVKTVSRIHYKPQDTSNIYTKSSWTYGTIWTRPTYFGRVYFESFATGSRILFKAPVWLSHRSWELHSIKANGAWQWNLRSYRLIPCNSEVISLSVRGSPKDIQRLFDAGLASPYDYTSGGLTILYYALRNHNIEVLKYLMRIGMSGLIGDMATWIQVLHSELNDYLTAMIPFAEQVTSDLSLTTHLLGYLEDSEYDDNTEYLPSSCNCRYGYFGPKIYKALLPYQSPSHQNTPLSSRLLRAMQVLEYRESIGVFRSILEPDWSTNPKAVHSYPGIPIITVVAYRLALTSLKLITTFPYRGIHGQMKQVGYSDSNLLDYFTFAVDIIKNTPDIHVSSDHHCQFSPNQTALGRVLLAITDHFYPHPSQVLSYYISDHIRVWLEALKQAGIDLETYGWHERKIIAEKDYIIRQHGEIRLIDFDFGPEPEDWKFYFGEPIYDYVREFWKLVEHPLLRVPGAWVDYDDGDDGGCRGNGYYT